MSWKFNPPPGWPEQPEGWQPPPGWAPDPSWPPAPAGWQFWVPAGSAPEPPQAPTVHEAPTSLANPTVPLPSSGQPGSAQPTSPYAAGSPGSYPPVSGSPGSYPPVSGSPGSYPPVSGSPPAGSYQPAGPYPPATSYPPAGSPAPPAGGSGAGTPWYSQWWAIGGAALGVLLAGCVGGAAVALVTDSGDDPSPPPAPPATAAPTETPQSPPTDPGGGDGIGPGEEQSGEGPAIIPLDLPSDSLHTVTFTYTGEAFFSSSLVDDQGEFVTSLGSSPFGASEYTGTWPLELGLFGSEASAIDITNADGPWTVTIQDISESPLWPEQTEGTGDAVLRIDPGAASDPVSVQGTHDGESNFIVWAYSPDVGSFDDRLLFNVIGEHSGEGEESFTSDQAVLHIRADGNWTIEPS